MKIGQMVRIKGTSRFKKVTGFIEKFEDVQWQGKLPQFIILDDGSCANPCQIKRIK